MFSVRGGAFRGWRRGTPARSVSQSGTGGRVRSTGVAEADAGGHLEEPIGEGIVGVDGRDLSIATHAVEDRDLVGREDTALDEVVGAVADHGEGFASHVELVEGAGTRRSAMVSRPRPSPEGTRGRCPRPATPGTDASSCPDMAARSASQGG